MIPGDQEQTVKYPTAALSSPTYESGSFDCWFSFWYYMNSPDPSAKDDGECFGCLYFLYKFSPSSLFEWKG